MVKNSHLRIILLIVVLVNIVRVVEFNEANCYQFFIDILPFFVIKLRVSIGSYRLIFIYSFFVDPTGDATDSERQDDARGENRTALLSSLSFSSYVNSILTHPFEDGKEQSKSIWLGFSSRFGNINLAFIYWDFDRLLVSYHAHTP